MSFDKRVLNLGLVLIQVPVLLSVQSVQEPCRSSCIKRALFRGYTQDFVLHGHVLTSLSVPSPLDCMRKCIGEPRCQSFNCEHVTKPTRLCELNTETKATRPVFYVKRTGFTYHDAMGPGNGWCNGVCPSPYNKVICPNGFAGMDCQVPMKSYKDWLDNGFKADGVYHVILQVNQDPFPVYCDQTTDGGGWTVIQRRKDGTIDFYRGWNDYKKGFGNLAGEFWLGNDPINIATTTGVTELRVELETFQGAKAFAKYNNFNISDEETNYTLSASGYNGNAGDSFGTETGNALLNTINNNMPFSTWDNDHDNHVRGGTCAVEMKGAWWFNDCYWSHLNGPYKGKGKSFGINWYSFEASNYESLKGCELKIRSVA